ncbi:hypothetical protein [Aeromonas veronii]|uniref:hypothetical protein n=5 Tax=Aeromonas veronii TaxID=654 RepID=UPI000718768C|nr:hypothetical protein [Aeromonas veronii]KRW04683.1 hypothetical protein AO725_00085 [Aeromonas veronii]KRW05137.1 hypothetical protein AO745_10585 [Aeromonas veronii]KRW08123.1 hypothetical protein AO732_08400 [Aeromonas veronii]KRW13501.1 hypothetical protein AO722_09225 [Aeromonas veronii]KRW17801.1 hypothetical protein AO734_06425 [Aeromonas veronii]
MALFFVIDTFNFTLGLLEMAKEKKNKTIHYKRAVISNTSSTLQELLEDALLNKDSDVFNAVKRKEFINSDSDYCRLINRKQKYNGIFFGQLVLWEPGKSQTYIKLDENSESYDIQPMSSEDIKDSRESELANKIQKEFINSILYFGVFDNHVVVLQSASLRVRELETHLSWFLGTCCNSISAESVLILKDKPTEETIKKIEALPVKTVKLGAPVGTYEEIKERPSDEIKMVPAVEGKTTYQPKNIKWVPKGIGVDVVRALMNAGIFEKVSLEDALDDANLKVSLEISYLRKTTASGQKMLDNLATSLRHMEDSDVRIELQGGGTLRGEDLRLSGNINVQTFNGLVDENDLYRQMHAWIMSKIDTEIEIELMS